MVDLHAFRAFAEGAAANANISYVLDTNFGLTADPSVVAVPHIRSITEAGLWRWVRGIEIGNEQDNYAMQWGQPLKVKDGVALPHYRNSSYTFENYFNEYRVFADAFVAAGMPRGILQGGTWAGSSWYSEIPRYLQAYGAEMNVMALHQCVNPP
jgi:hypothetical protein